MKAKLSKKEREEAKKFRKKKILEVLKKKNPTQLEVNIVREWLEHYGKKHIKKDEVREAAKGTELEEDVKRAKPNLEDLKDVHAKICGVLRKYCDLDEKYYNILALWVIGTYFHKKFLTYPYIFLNAMKGSGKTRLLKLMATLSKNGKVIANISEAVLFRTAEDSTFCIDELEQIGRKEKATLRELLDAAYKKGLIVERAYKMKGKYKEHYKIERFNVFCPVAMANIRGMEDVLSDRCITLIIEKSNNWQITRLLEIFEYDSEIQEILGYLKGLVSLQNDTNAVFNLYHNWNKYIVEYKRHHDIHDINGIKRQNDTKQEKETTQTTPNNTTTLLFNKIAQTPLNSRELELFFPLFIIADYCNVLDDTIGIAKEITQSRQETDIFESKDVALIDFISQSPETSEFIPLKDLLGHFKVFLEEDQEDAKWTNLKWLGKALKRLGIIKKKRRFAQGREVVLNYAKAKQKIRMFKEVEPHPPAISEEKLKEEQE